MASFSTLLATLAVAHAAFAQVLNPWPELDNSFSFPAEAFDGNVSTVAELEDGASVSFFFSAPHNFSGLYVLSDNDSLLTDYAVYATWTDYKPLVLVITAGRVCHATGAFVVVTFADLEGNPFVQTDTLVLTVESPIGAPARIREIWPIFPGDKIVDPHNKAACPPNPSDDTSTVSEPADGWKVSSWRSDNKPIAVGKAVEGSSANFTVDGSNSTVWTSQSFVNQSATLDLQFDHNDTLQGLWILSAPGRRVTNAYATATVGNSTVGFTNPVVGRVINAKEDMALLRFVDGDGMPADLLTSSIKINFRHVVGGRPAIQEIYPVWPGEDVPDDEEFDDYQ